MGCLYAAILLVLVLSVSCVNPEADYRDQAVDREGRCYTFSAVKTSQYTTAISKSYAPCYTPTPEAKQ